MEAMQSHWWGFAWPMQEYTFLLTHGNGRRYNGFCRQILPPAPRVGSRLRYPQVLCIISEHPWCALFFKVGRAVPPTLPTGGHHHHHNHHHQRFLRRHVHRCWRGRPFVAGAQTLALACAGCWMQVLQLVEQILKGPEPLLDAAVPELAPDSHLGALLTDLCRQLSTDPAPGEVIRRVCADVAAARSPPCGSSRTIDCGHMSLCMAVER